MKNYELRLARHAQKDLELIKASGALLKKVKGLLEVLQDNPMQSPPAFEKLVGDLEGFYSRRINLQHRLVYQIREDEKAVVIARMWTHYSK